jgi:hypothetical protein
MTQSQLTLAIAVTLSLGLINSSPTPVMREMPLSKSDIVIAAQDTSGQDSVKMGESSGTQSGTAGQSSESKTGSEKMTESPPKQDNK